MEGDGTVEGYFLPSFLVTVSLNSPKLFHSPGVTMSLCTRRQMHFTFTFDNGPGLLTVNVLH
jgi:hypothetical protein